MNCPYCGTPKFRTSRLRIEDIPRFVLLQLPVRCRSCRERFYVRIPVYVAALRAQRIREDEDAAARIENSKP